MSKLGGKQFWKTVKHLKKSSSQIPTLKRGAIEASSNIDKGSLLNELFSRNFNGTIPQWVWLSVLYCWSLHDHPQKLCSALHGEEVFSLLIALQGHQQSLRTWWKFWKNARSNHRFYYTSFNRAFQFVHHKWNYSSQMEAVICCANSFISLKLMLTIPSILITGQYFFRQWYGGSILEKSMVTALVSTFHDILQLMENGLDVSLLCFELHKAFDSVPHLPLL